MSLRTTTTLVCDRCGRDIPDTVATAEPLQDLDCRGNGFEPVRYDDLCGRCRATIGRLVDRIGMRRTA